MIVRARYRPIGLGPFALRYPATVKIEVEVPDDMTKKQLEKSAREATPEGYEFIEVLVLD